MNPSVETTEVRLDLQKIAHTVQTSRLWLHDVNVRTWSDIITDSLVHAISGYMLTDRLAGASHTFTVERPASAWQHVKRDWFPTFSRLLRRPVRYEQGRVTIDIENIAGFPKAEVPYPRELGPVVMHQIVSNSPVRWQP